MTKAERQLLMNQVAIMMALRTDDLDLRASRTKKSVLDTVALLAKKKKKRAKTYVCTTPGMTAKNAGAFSKDVGDQGYNIFGGIRRR